MNKNSMLTAAGILLSFVIAVGGWVLTRYLIELKSDKMLSMTFSIAINKLDNRSPGLSSVIADGDDIGDNPQLARPSLSENDMVSMLQRWESEGRETPHEPTGEQLNMEQAIDAGEAWLSRINELYIFPEEMLQFSNPRAYLFQKLPQGQEGQFLPPAYSYWAVNFTNDSMCVNMLINAVTGQAWETEITIVRLGIAINEYDVANALDTFVSALALKGDEGGEAKTNVVTRVTNVYLNAHKSIESNDILFITDTLQGDYESLYASQDFANGKAYAEVIANGWHLEDGRWIVCDFTMHLTVEKHE